MPSIRALAAPAFLLLASCEAETITTPVIVEPPCVEIDVLPGGMAAADADPRALTEFRQELAPYGAWSDDPTWGTVWTPYDADFVPYVTDGHWARLGDRDDHAVWLSDTSWGVVTLHRGRWIATPTVEGRARWRWIPGLRWAGAWATWTHAGDRVGWGPTPPSVIWRHGVALRIAPLGPVAVASREASDLGAVTARPDQARVAFDAELRDRVDRSMARRAAIEQRLSTPVASAHWNVAADPFDYGFDPSRAERFSTGEGARSASAWGGSAFSSRAADAFMRMPAHARFTGAAAAHFSGGSRFSARSSGSYAHFSGGRAGGRAR